jgi:flavin-dependent dehydrogenase
MMRVGIVGTGPAGCAAAIALCRLGRQVILIGDGVDGVGEQLHPAARPWLHQLGLSSLPGQLECFGVKSAWHADELAEEHFLSHPYGTGWLLDRSAFGETLRQAAIRQGALLRAPCRLTGVQRTASETGRWNLQLSDGEETCDWLIDATGRRSTLSRLLGVKRRIVHRQVAVVGWLITELDEDVDQTLTVESTSSGWWYSCRLPERRRVAGYVTGGKPETETWESRLRATRHLGPLVQQYRVERACVTRAADSTILEQCYGPGWMAVGDAAVSYDPLASRGLVSALKSGLDAAALVGASDAKLAAWQIETEADFARYCEERSRWVADPKSAI